MKKLLLFLPLFMFLLVSCGGDSSSMDSSVSSIDSICSSSEELSSSVASSSEVILSSEEVTSNDSLSSEVVSIDVNSSENVSEGKGEIDFPSRP